MLFLLQMLKCKKVKAVIVISSIPGTKWRIPEFFHTGKCVITTSCKTGLGIGCNDCYRMQRLLFQYGAIHLIDSVGLVFLPCLTETSLQFFYLFSALTTLTFILFHICWTVILFHSCDKQNYAMILYVIITHLAASYFVSLVVLMLLRISNLSLPFTLLMFRRF